MDTIFRTRYSKSFYCLFLTIFLIPGLWAQSPAKNQLQQNEANQQEIQGQTNGLVSQVQGLIDELEANGISGADKKLLETAKDKLANLSGPQMEEVLASLKEAATAPTGDSMVESAHEAYNGQRRILTQFEKILQEADQRNTLYQLAAEFKAASEHEATTEKATANVARETAGKDLTHLTPTQATTEQMLQTEQQEVIDEISSSSDQLESQLQADSTTTLNGHLLKAEDDIKNGTLRAALAQAKADLEAGDLNKAMSDQKAVRDSLRELTHDLNPPSSETDTMAENLSNLGKLIDAQKQLMEQTKDPDGRKKVADLGDQQSDLVDDADTILRDSTSTTPESAANLLNAENAMKDSLAALNPKGPQLAKSLKDQDAAIANLLAAREEMQRKLAAAKLAEAQSDATQNAPPDPASNIADSTPPPDSKLQKAVQDAMQQQQQITDQSKDAVSKTNAPDTTKLAQAKEAQDQLQKAVQSLQPDAQTQSPQVASNLKAAADKMAQAKQDLADPTKVNDAITAQKDAKAQLSAANEQLKQNLASSDAAQPAPPVPPTPPADTTPDSQLQSAIQTAMDQQQQISDQAQNAVSKNGPPDASKLAQAKQSQDQLQKAVQNLQPDADKQSPQAATNLKAASDKMAQAEQDLADPSKVKDAVSAQQDAKAYLSEAKEQLKQAMASTAGEQSQQQSQQQQSQQGQQQGQQGQKGKPQPGQPGGDLPGQPGVTPGDHSLSKASSSSSNNAGKYISVEARDRAAIDQSKAEKRPEEYGPLIDQYLKNLSDQSTSGNQ